MKGLKAAGFEGFRSVRDLSGNAAREIPRHPGVYVVLRASKIAPRFRRKSAAFHFKGRDPTLPLAHLKSRWVSGAIILYVGKAGTATGKATLCRRIGNYLHSGLPRKSSHWGGRAIWQLRDSTTLQIAWLVTLGREAREKEMSLLADFKNMYQVLPFANGSR